MRFGQRATGGGLGKHFEGPAFGCSLQGYGLHLHTRTGASTFSGDAGARYACAQQGMC